MILAVLVRLLHSRIIESSWSLTILKNRGLHFYILRQMQVQILLFIDCYFILTVSSCPGANKEVDQCSSGRQCVASTTDSRRKWSSWGQFSACSSSCEGGVRHRSRTCEGTRGQCYGSPSDVQSCGHSQCPLDTTISDGSYLTVIIGGWREDWLQNVTFIHSDGRQCPGPDLPIWLADHFSVLVGFRILTCGGRSNDGNTLCWFLNMEGNQAVWTRTSK